MEFRELKQEDIDAVKDNSVSRGILSKQPEVIDFGYTLEHEGKILGIGGIRLINTTTAWAWVDLTHYAGERIITVYRVIKEWMEILAKDKGIKRLQAYIETDFEEAIRLVKHLGFHYEYTMSKFVGNKPACMFVRFFNGE
ncbi:hypothetical protein LCGC14_2382790 [marine sediment metagenome]|uniref:N-acetyltransferase domain-containing protein n=1 Tax=marine sediment metagenome TaxID=412755 RepID=A0A0F9C0G4_9ZZZZ